MLSTTIINTTSDKKLRLFIATDWQGSAEALDCVPTDEAIPWRIKQVPVTQWHLTWLFLGDTDPSHPPQIEKNLAAIAKNHTAISTHIQGSLLVAQS